MLHDPEGGAGFGGAYGFNGNIQVVQNHGFRAFRYNPDDSLTSLIYDYEWTDGVNRAVCATSATWKKPAKECPFPHKGCSHGFYAYYDEDYYGTGITRGIAVVNGVIDGYGRCVIGSKGYRSEYAALVAFVRPFAIDDTFLRMLRLERPQAELHVVAALERKFPTVPIFDNVDELRKVVPLPGRPPRNAE
jgi:hypothetical protein